MEILQVYIAGLYERVYYNSTVAQCVSTWHLNPNLYVQLSIYRANNKQNPFLRTNFGCYDILACLKTGSDARMGMGSPFTFLILMYELSRILCRFGKVFFMIKQHPYSVFCYGNFNPLITSRCPNGDGVSIYFSDFDV